MIRDPIRAVTRAVQRGINRIRQRYIATLDGTSMGIKFGAPIVTAINDTARIDIATSQTGVVRDWIDGIMQFDAGNLLQLTNCTATVDGGAIASGASVAAYLDGKTHIWVLTFTGVDTINYIGQNGAAANYAAGSPLDFYFTPIATGITTHHPISNGSLVYQQATGSGLGSDTVADGGFDLPASFGSPSSAWTFSADIGDIDTTVASKFHVTTGVSGTAWNSGGTVNDYTKSNRLAFTLSGAGASSGIRVYLFSSLGTQLGAASGGAYFSVDGDYEIIIPADTVAQNFVVGVYTNAAFTNTIDIDNVTVQEAPNALIFTNFIASTWGAIFSRVGTCWTRIANSICDA